MHIQPSASIPTRGNLFTYTRSLVYVGYACFWILAWVHSYVKSIRVYVVLSVCSPLGNGHYETKTRSSQETEERIGGGRTRMEKRRKKKSEDQLVARIRFRTVSNDTGQDTAMVSKILIPTPLSL